MTLRPVALLAAALVAGSFPIAAPAAAAPGAVHPAPAGRRPASRPVPAAARPSPLRARGLYPQPVRQAAAAAVSAPAKVDPAVVGQRAARNGTVPVTVTGNAAQVAARIHAQGGRVLAHAADRTVAVIAKSRVGALAGTPAVSHIGVVNRPVEAGAPPAGTASQGVTASDASAWHSAGINGAGVKIAIIDGGFGTSANQYDTEVTAGHLGTDPQLINEDCLDGNNVSTPYVDEHGLAVAELASQEAPAAQIYLYCVNSPEGVVNAEAAAHAAGVRVISSSLGWYGDARGDGTASPGTVAYAARTARQQGMLWVNSAGNEVPQHFGGSLADANGDHYLDIGNSNVNAYPYESNFYVVAPETGGVPSDFAFVFQWDNWPTTNNTVTLDIAGIQCTTAYAPNNGLDGCQGTRIGTATARSTAGGAPTVSIDLADHGLENHSAYDQIWQVGVHFDTGFTKGAHWDLFGNGAADGASDLSCPTGDSTGNCVFSAGALNDSMLSPANSPYVLAAGAADVGADGSTAGTLEYFSSRGPTVDGRPKPDLTGWDGVSSYPYPGGFYGTSAAAPNVAGAAALVASANPGLDAAQIQAFLEQRANSGVPTNPAANGTGHGLLTLGPPSGIAPPTPASYQPLASPARVLDTRTAVGNHRGAVADGSVVTVSFPGLPADATAVAVNITGVGATATSYLTAYPSGTAPPATSNLNLSQTDSTAAVLAVVSLNSQRTITIRASGSAMNVVVDELGYFGNGSETGLYTSLAAPSRVLDTRTTTGGHHGRIPADGSARVAADVPAGAVAVVANVTAVSMAAPGFLGTGPGCSLRTSTLNFQKATRANLAIVGLDADGTFCIANGPTATNVVVDVEGYLMPGTGSGYVALPAPQRIVDTRNGNGGSAGGHASRALAATTTTSFYGANVGDVPATATALLTGVAEASTTTGGSYLSVFPGTTKPAVLSSTVNFSPGRVVANASLTGLSNNRFAVYNSGGSTHAVVDLFGYFAPPPAPANN